MRWLLVVLVLSTAAALAGWQALGLGVDLGGDGGPSASAAPHARAGMLPVVAFERSGSGPLASAPLASTPAPAVLTGATALEAMAALRRSMDRRALEGLADELAERVAGHPEDAEALFVLCEASRLLGRVDAADRHSEAAVERFPHRARAHLERARAVSEHMKRASLLGAARYLGAFKSSLSRSLELDPTNVEARCDQIGFLSFAPGLLGGDSDKALAMARDMADEHPARAAAMECVVLVTDDRLDDAVHSARGALERLGAGLPAHDEDLRQLHLVLASTLGEVEAYDEARTHFERAKDGPDDTVRFQALYLHAKQRLEADTEHAQALADIETFLAGEPYGELMPFLGAGWWRKGQALEGLERLDEALAAYERALELDPDFDKAEDALDALRDRLG